MKSKNIKSAVIISTVVLLLLFSVYGLVRLVDSATGYISAVTPPPSGSVEEPVESGMPDPVVPDPVLPSQRLDITGITLEDDILTIGNSGDRLRYSIHTLPYKLVIEIHDRFLEELPEETLYKDDAFESICVEVPGEHLILITVNMKKPFNVTHEQSGDDAIFTFNETLNADVLVYRNSTTRQFFTFRDIFLTSKSDSNSRHYMESYSQDGLSYSIRLENARARKLQEETLVFNDNLLNRLEIKKDDTHTTITFHSTRKLIYYPNTRDYDSTITLIDPDNGKDYIVIDPGHGGLDPGATMGDRIEKGITLELSMILYRELERRGYAVYVLREEDIFIGLFERIEIANLLKAGLFLSIHVDSLDDHSVNGILSQYKNDKKLANLVHQHVLDRTGARNMGIGYRNNLLLLNRAEMPIMLFEAGYLTNDGDWERLNDQEYLTKMAMGMADGIEEYLAGN